MPKVYHTCTAYHPTELPMITEHFISDMLARGRKCKVDDMRREKQKDLFGLKELRLVDLWEVGEMKLGCRPAGS